MMTIRQAIGVILLAIVLLPITVYAIIEAIKVSELKESLLFLGIGILLVLATWLLMGG